MERILCAAIWYQDQTKYEHQPTNVQRGIVVAGRRHHNCFLTLFQLKGEANIDKDLCAAARHQGFLTSEDRYVTRKEAFRIAKEAGQIIRPVRPEEREGSILFSEDLY